MALTNLIANITLDLYDHDGTRPTIKAIQLDDNTRYVLAHLTYRGADYDVASDASVQLIIIRPDKVGAQIIGSVQEVIVSIEDDTPVTINGAYAELDQPAIAVAGTLLGQFIITSEDQILRTQIFAINNGQALDADEWAGDYDGYNLDELVEKVDTAVSKVDGMEADVSKLKSDFDKLYNAAFVTDSASGGVAHFEDGADSIPLKSLKVNIEPVQSSSGDPSPDNVRPISGWNSVKVTRSGKNICPTFESRTSNGITFEVNDDGTVVANGTATATVELVVYLTLEKGTYTLTGCPSDGGPQSYQIWIYNSATGRTTGIEDRGNGSTGTLTEKASCRITIRIASGFTANNLKFAPMLVYGSDAPTEFEPYNGNTYDISLASAGTVYGGTLDVLTGVLTVDRAIVDMGTLTWTYDSAIPRFYTSGLANVILQPATNYDVANAVASMYKTVSFNELYLTGKQNGTLAISSSKAISAINTNYTDANTFKTAMSGQMFVYPLAEPQTIQLTPQQITSLLGINNVWSDAGDVDVEYRADTKLYIDRRIAEVTA